MRRITWCCVGALLLGAGFVEAASACHVGGPGCGPAETQPFDPRPSLTLANPATGAQSDVTFGWEHAEPHEQLVGALEVDLPAGFEANLEAPEYGATVGLLDVVINFGGANQRFLGTIVDYNDWLDWPRGGVYKWEAEIQGGGIEYPLEIFADRNAPDGHLHAEAVISEQLIQRAHELDGFLVSARATLLGFAHDPAVSREPVPVVPVVPVPFMRNPTPPAPTPAPPSSRPGTTRPPRRRRRRSPEPSVSRSRSASSPGRACPLRRDDQARAVSVNASTTLWGRSSARARSSMRAAVEPVAGNTSATRSEWSPR